METINLKETMELIEKLRELISELTKDAEDGKLTLFEIIGNYPQIFAMVEEAKDYKAIQAELKDLNKNELVQLSTNLINIVFDIIELANNLKADKKES